MTAPDPLVFYLDVPMVVTLRSGKVRPLTANDRLHHHAKARLVRKIREKVGWAAKAARIPPARHITVQLNYRPGGRSVTDAPNLAATSKPAIDGVVDAGVVPDDADEWVTEESPVIHRGPGSRTCWLVVEVVPAQVSGVSPEERPWSSRSFR